MNHGLTVGTIRDQPWVRSNPLVMNRGLIATIGMGDECTAREMRDRPCARFVRPW